MILTLFLIIIILVGIIIYLNPTKSIMSLPGPKGYYYIGNLFQLGSIHAITYEKWAQLYGPVFQIRLGNVPVVIVNSYDSAKKLFIEQGQAYLSRPVFYTFGKVSSTAGFTIGTSPWDESCRLKRKAAASGLNKLNVERYIPIVEEEVKSLIKDLYQFGDAGKTAIVPLKFVQKFALNVSLVVNYGTRLRSISDELFQEITETEAFISHFRSTSNDYRDYLPILRHLPNSSKQKQYDIIRSRRDVYMAKLLNGLKDEISQGTDRPCITGTILKNPELTLSPLEISSICLSMVSANLDTLASTLYWSLGHLAKCPEIQQRAYGAIRDIYGENPFNIHEEKVEYIKALHKEASRYFSVLKLGLPRKTVSESNWGNHIIPADTIVFYNTWAINHDPEKYQNPEEFTPERYLKSKEEKTADLDHYGFGVGRRMCLGNILAEKEMYIAYGQIIEHFDIKLSEIESEKNFDTNPRTATLNPHALAHWPFPYKVRFVPRNPQNLERWLKE